MIALAEAATVFVTTVAKATGRGNNAVLSSGLKKRHLPIRPVGSRCPCGNRSTSSTFSKSSLSMENRRVAKASNFCIADLLSSLRPSRRLG